MKSKPKFKPIPKDIGDYVAYSEESRTGLFWRVNQGTRAKKGKEAGCILKRGYFTTKFRQKIYFNHRIIYFLNTGVDPQEKQIDHIDGNRLNNKIWNLRPATDKQNKDNVRKRKDNTSGVTGVCWNKRDKMWNTFITTNNIRLNLGCFHKSDKDKAIAVRIAVELDPRFKDQEFRNSHNDEHTPSPEMLVWAKQYLEDRIERLNWKEKYNLQ